MNSEEILKKPKVLFILDLETQFYEIDRVNGFLMT